MTLKRPTCPNCAGTLVVFKRFEVLNVDQVNGVYHCAHCDEEFYDYAKEERKPPMTSKEVVDEILKEEQVFTECRVCHKNNVLPNSWFDICPECEFWQNLENNGDQ